MALVVVVVYAVVRQVQDYLINPYVMGKITKLHPLVILFAVIAGEHIGGILGLILAVPIAGIIKIIFEYSLDKINLNDTK
jgi:predicted PurR-regulated permease PerM